MAIRLVIFEDNEILRSSLSTLLGSSDDYQIVGMYGDVMEAEQIIRSTRPDVVVLDIDMPLRDGISAIPIIKQVDNDISVVMYTQFEDDDRLFRSLCAGADGYVLKKTTPLKLFEAIAEVHKGGVPMSPAIAQKVLNSFREKAKPKQEEYFLTVRETEVLKLLVKGYTVKYIAADLHMAYETCRSHLRNIYKKLHVRCGKEAIAKILKDRVNLNR
ncbi:MAG TPA: response regulator transcription factor [Lunatimonas sp.]|nr:response regulator transcription factor [Lunatimonas sp.]